MDQEPDMNAPDRCEGCGEVACECLKECAHGNPWDDCRACSLGLDDVATAASTRTVRLVPDLFDDDAPVETWAFQWKHLVEADPSTLTAGGRRRRAAMVAIAAHINARGVHIEEAARAVVSADEWYCNAVDTGGDSDEAAIACSDTIARLSMAIDETKPPTRRPAAVDAWRAVPDHDRDALLDWLDGVHRSGMRGESLSPTAHVAVRAPLTLAREAEGEPAPPRAEPMRTPCPRCGKPLARRGVYHVCPHGVPCGSSGWCSVCANRSGT